MKAILALEDGTQFIGESVGAIGTCIGEVVFETGMTGYLEVLTDPSYVGQLVTMTYPLIGNYGVNTEDQESPRPHVKGFIVRELCDEPSNFRSQDTLNSYMIKHNIIGIQGIDTRALTRILRNKGTMNGVISTDPDFRQEDWIEKLHNHKIIKPVEQVTSKEVKHIEGTGKRVAVLDYGIKTSIIHCLQKRNCDIYVFPATSEADTILAVEPDGIMLSNGPGNPKDCTFQIEVLKELIGKKPIFGICLGHQLTALAYGGDTEKLKYGHRGGNHPVKDLAKDRTYITSQNHGYVVVADKLDSKRAVVSHININDGTVEGVRYLDTPTFTVQFHPEASPGPKETEYLFDDFISLMDTFKHRRFK
ncbi:MAG: carbamoyl phosphate synthase small subunit [Clostridiaceae bacterium]|jgi:carbamoyl-phosphate synthase small subunit|nr:carbamoyl phosphate synthase small subunit [Clostridiaceae bacterium]